MVMTIKLVRVDNRGREREAPLGGVEGDQQL